MKLEVARSEAFELKAGSKSQTRPELAQLKVCGHQSETHAFRLVARRLGNVNFTVQVIHTLFSAALSLLTCATRVWLICSTHVCNQQVASETLKNMQSVCLIDHQFNFVR